MSNNVVITIARQYGSAGLAIGERIADALGIKFYDKELITMSANQSNINADVLKDIDEKAANSLLYTLALGSSIYNMPSAIGYNIPINDKLFITQSEIIKRLADESPCVIVGRCADYVLRDYPGRVSVFLYAGTEFRQDQVMKQHNVSATEALDLMSKTDRRRMNYYNFYTGRKWGRQENYHMSIDSSALGVEGTAGLIADFVKSYSEKSGCVI